MDNVTVDTAELRRLLDELQRRERPTARGEGNCDCLVCRFAGQTALALPVLLDRLDTLEAERKIGSTPHKCLNDECGTVAYGTGYGACPSCGDTSGRDAGQT